MKDKRKLAVLVIWDAGDEVISGWVNVRMFYGGRRVGAGAQHAVPYAGGMFGPHPCPLSRKAGEGDSLWKGVVMARLVDGRVEGK